MPTKKTIQKYYDIIKSGKFEESEIISFRSLLNQNSNDPGVQSLLNYFDKNKPYDLTWMQKEKGLNWLKNRILKSDGTPRNTAETREIDDVTLPGCRGLYQIAEMVKNYSDFKFVDLINDSNSPFGMPHYIPIYRMIDHFGFWFEYCIEMGKITITDQNIPQFIGRD